MLGWKPKFFNRKIASVRYRCINPLEEMRRRNFPVELFNEHNISQYSGVIFSKLYDDKNYSIAVDLKNRGKKVIFDICDNHFYNPFELEKFKIVRKQLVRMLAISDLVVTSTDALADVLSNETMLQPPPVVIGDAVEEEPLFSSSKKKWLCKLTEKISLSSIKRNGKVNILWFGIHGGENAPYGMLDLLNQKDLLIELSEMYSFRLIVLSNSREKYEKYIAPFPFETRYYEWGGTPLREIVKEVDINIIPISINPFTVCKSNNRLALALYSGLPTVADSIPSYQELAPFCVLDNWRDGLNRYLSDPLSTHKHLRDARAYIRQKYCIKEICNLWEKNLLASL